MIIFFLFLHLFFDFIRYVNYFLNEILFLLNAFKKIESQNYNQNNNLENNNNENPNYDENVNNNNLHCDFCGYSDENLDEDSLALHLFKQCRWVIH